MIDPELAAFLEDGVGIHIGTRNERHEPNGARVISIKVDADGRHLVLYMPEVSARRVMPDLHANGQAAIVFGRPIDERSCQVKGVFVDAHAPSAAERAHAQAQWDAFLQNLEAIGIPRASSSGWVHSADIAIRVRATAVFEQTPGPGAGAPRA